MSSNAAGLAVADRSHLAVAADSQDLADLDSHHDRPVVERRIAVVVHMEADLAAALHSPAVAHHNPDLAELRIGLLVARHTDLAGVLRARHPCAASRPLCRSSDRLRRG